MGRGGCRLSGVPPLRAPVAVSAALRGVAREHVTQIHEPQRHHDQVVLHAVASGVDPYLDRSAEAASALSLCQASSRSLSSHVSAKAAPAVTELVGAA